MRGFCSAKRMHVKVEIKIKERGPETEGKIIELLLSHHSLQLAFSRVKEKEREGGGGEGDEGGRKKSLLSSMPAKYNSTDNEDEFVSFNSQKKKQTKN